MKLNSPKLILTIFLVVIVALLGLYTFNSLKKGADIIPSAPTTSTPSQVSTTTSGEAGEIVSTQNVVCGGNTYIFDAVRFKDSGYFNDIYKNVHTKENLILHARAAWGEETYQGKTYKVLGVFSVLAVPRDNCDRIYLTVLRPETDAPGRGMFEWRLGADEPRELTVSDKFREDFVVSYPDKLDKAVSSDGEKIVVTQPDEQVVSEKTCSLRMLYLINLRKDTAELLMKLPKTETFDRGRSETGNCGGVNIGWVDETTIYYDVYDATKPGAPLKERRALKI